MLLEIIVQSVADAKAAEAGGADRLEVVRDIEEDGLTPSLDLVRSIQAEIRLPLRVMVRERNTFSVEDDEELQRLRRTIRELAELGVEGAVLGFARSGEIDVETTLSVLSAAPSLRATFHRAFDAVSDPLRAIHAVSSIPQVDRILTSGGSGDWAARSGRLSEYAGRAGRQLIILAGGGMDEDGIRVLRAAGSIPEVHVGRAACEPPRPGAPVSQDRVHRLRLLAG